MFIKRNIICMLFCIVGLPAYGQSDMFLTQQWFSRINFNPAATGASNNVDIFLLNRQQWAGFENAPKTTLLNAHNYFPEIRSGLGLSVMYDRLGVSHKTFDAMVAYAYHFNVGEQTLLSLGLSGGIYNSNWDPMSNTVERTDIADPEMSTERTSRTSPDFDAGVELNSHGITVGASMTHIIGSSPENAYTGKPAREYYGYLRYRLSLNRKFDLAPGIMYRNANYGNFFDYNLTAFLMKKYWAGVSFRPNNAFAAMLGMEIGMFRIGYAYDRSIGKVASLAANTHEIMLAVRIHKPQPYYKRTPRFLD